MIVVTVEPADSPPVRYRGRVWIRTGPRRGIATMQDERILSEKRRYHDRPYDARPLQAASLADVNRRFFEEVYLPAAFAPDVLEANDRTYEQRLAATKMVTAAADPIPTVLGILVLGTGVRDYLPGAYIQFLRIAGQDLADSVIDEQLVEGAIGDILRRIDDKMLSHNRTNVEFAHTAVEQRGWLYPPAALQQLLRNAVLHRAYEGTNAPVRVTWFDDRIEIFNPGGPFGAVTPENFGEPGVTDYRNPNLAEALRVLGFVQRFGAGIALARKELERNGNPPPAFNLQPTHVMVTLRPRG